MLSHAGVISWLRAIKQELGGPCLESKQAAIEIAIKSLGGNQSDTIIDLREVERGVWEHGRKH